MPIGCVVPGCTSGYRSNKEKVNFFALPRNIEDRKQWQTAIRRPDLKLEGRYYVCNHHFPETNILWQKTLYGPDGTVLGVSPYNKPKLTAGTVPIFFPWSEQSKQKHSAAAQCETNTCSAVEEQKAPCKEAIDYTVKPVEPTANTKSFAEDSANDHRENAAANTITFDDVVKGPITLPTDWTRTVHSVGEESFVLFSQTNYKKMDGLYDEINSKNIFVSPNLSLLMKVNKVVVDICKFQLQNSISDLNSFQEALFRIHTLNVCHGADSATDVDGIDCRVISTDCYNIKRHKQCTLLSDSNQCEFCYRVKSTILRSKQRKASGQVCQSLPLQTMSQNQKSHVLKLKKKFLQTSKKAKRLEGAVKKLGGTLAECYQKMTATNESAVLNALKNTAIPKNQQDVILEILKASKCKLPNGHRYSEDWMMLCLLLHIWSPSNYNWLRVNNILPLPCTSTIRRNLAGINTERVGLAPRKNRQNLLD